MKKLLGFVVVLIISTATYAQKGARIEFKSDTIDYGTVSKADNGVRVFEFTNTGDAPLTIKNVQSTAGVTATKPSGAIQPGQSGRIELKYNMHPGPIRKTVTVESNAVNTPVVALKLKGTVTE